MKNSGSGKVSRGEKSRPRRRRNKQKTEIKTLWMRVGGQLRWVRAKKVIPFSRDDRKRQSICQLPSHKSSRDQVKLLRTPPHHANAGTSRHVPQRGLSRDVGAGSHVSRMIFLHPGRKSQAARKLPAPPTLLPPKKPLTGNQS